METVTTMGAGAALRERAPQAAASADRGASPIEARDAAREAPYADALRAHAAREPLMLMVPAHAAGPEGLSAGLAEFAGEQAVRLDIPQLIDGIDSGEGSPLDRALALAAEAWCARRSWFLVNGSSQGNRMATVAVALRGAGGTVLAQRSAHSSLTDGLIVSGLTPRWVLPSVDAERGINHGVTAGSLRLALAAAAEADGAAPAAVYVISPSYFGAVADVPALAEVAHEHGAPLIVDAAWGAHFGFHEGLPAFPTSEGADVVVTSTHKMGGSLGQSAMIHLAEGPFADELEPLLERAFRLTQSTSASSLLLGSLDVARRSLVAGGPGIGASIAAAGRLRAWVRAQPELELVSDGFAAVPDISGADPLRVSIDVRGTGLTGYELRSRLAEEFAVYTEIATLGAIVAFLGPGKPLPLERFTTAVRAVIDSVAERREAVVAESLAESQAESAGEAGERGPRSPAPAARAGTLARLALPAPGETRLSPREAFFAASELVPAAESAGRISADALAAYPPGIPNILPGETITAEAVAYLQAVAASPIGFVRGAHDAGVSRMRVLRDPEPGS